MRVELSDEALADLVAAADWYIDSQAPLVAEALHAEVVRAIARLRQMPLIGRPAFTAARLWPLHRFPYSIVYRVRDGQVRVIAVMHHSRKPGYWRHRS